MSSKLSEQNKIDVALVPQALNNTNATGAYFPMVDFRDGLAILQGGALADTKTSKIELLQATDAAGSGSKAITGKSATVTSPLLATEATIALATVLANDAVTINGLTFTAHATTTTVASRQFSIGGTDTADGDALVTCINDQTYGVSGVTATNAAGTITLKSTVPGKTTITITAAAATITPAVTKHQAYVDFTHFDLDHAGGFTHVAVKVTTTGNGVFSALLVRDNAREAITHAVGASA